MFVPLLLLALAVPQAAAPPQPPRDRAVTPRPASAPDSPAAASQLARQQEERGAVADAEATLMRARAASPSDRDVITALASFYNRRGDFEKAVAALEEAAQLAPDDPQLYQIIATYYWEKAFKDARLLPADRYTYVMRGIAAIDRALTLKPDYADALTYKNILLRMRANLESDPVLKQQLIAEADELRNKAIELNKTRTAIGSASNGVMLGPVPPPPPPPPTAGDYPYPAAPIRVGGNIKTPMKIKDVPPVYPAEAQASGIQGVVIIEATIDPVGRVSNAKVLRSIPALDQAALDAVNQWEFKPTLLNGAAVPVIMTVTVNFTMQ